MKKSNYNGCLQLRKQALFLLRFFEYNYDNV